MCALYRKKEIKPHNLNKNLKNTEHTKKPNANKK